MSYVIDQIKSRIDISALVSKKVTLKRRGNGEYVGLCPFHQEKSPSFYVSDNKGFYHCFGCGAHGDIFTYLMQGEYLNFTEALEQLANEAGVSLPKKDKTESHAQDRRDTLIAVYEYATTYYTKKLFCSEGRQALNYLMHRGLSEEVIVQYRLGFAPANHQELYNELKTRFEEKDILDSKVLSKGDYGIYNAFKNRVIFPIFNIHGKVIAFGGRILGSGEPKYLNSPETSIFKKNQTLYNLNFAKREAIKQKNVIVVEGYMDALTLSNYGIDNVVAPLGTSISTEHISTLWKIVDNITLCLDADNAGKAASVRVALEILPYIKTNKTLSFVTLKGGKDPDEVITNQGKDFFNKMAERAIPLSELLFNSHSGNLNLSLPENIAKLRKELQLTANKINDYHLQTAYHSYFKSKIFELTSFRKKTNKPNLVQSNHIHHLQSVMNDKEVNPLTVLVTIINHPNLLFDEEIYYDLHEMEIRSKFLDKIRNYILNFRGYSNDQKNLCEINLRKTLEEKFQFRYNDQELDYFAQERASYEEAKRGIIRIFKLNNLIIIQNQIEFISKMLIEKQDEDTYEKLSYLKKTEANLKTELNLIN